MLFLVQTLSLKLVALVFWSEMKLVKRQCKSQCKLHGEKPVTYFQGTIVLFPHILRLLSNGLHTELSLRCLILNSIQIATTTFNI